MSQLLTVMLIGRQAFLILMATASRRLQSVSHDIHRLANPPCRRSQLFLENCVPGVSLGRPPGPNVRGKLWQGREDVAAVKNFSWSGKEDFLSSMQQVLLGHSQTGSQMRTAGRCKRHHDPCLKECSASLGNPDVHTWPSSTGCKAGQRQ